ncbi:MAG: hypothetical protein AAFQ94_07345 [Bacteroidota bacterium]
MSRERSHITPEQYQKYLNGELSADEAYEIERLLQSTPLYDEAMDGLEMLDLETLSTDIDSLKKEIPLPVKEQKKKRSWLKVASMIALLIAGIPVLWLIVDQQQSKMLSDQQEKEVFTEESSAAESLTENPPVEKTEMAGSTSNESDKIINANPETNQPQDQKPAPKESKREELISEAKTSEPVAAAPAPLIIEIIEEEEIAEEVIAFADEADAEVVEEAFIFENIKSEEKTMNTRAIRMEADKKRKLKKASSRSVVGSGRNFPLNDEKLSDSVTNSEGTTDDLKSLLDDDTIADNFKLIPSMLFPIPAGGQKSFEDYLKENDLLLKKKRRHEPSTISFLVQPDSTVTDVRMIEGDSLQFDQISKIILDGPKWIPTDNTTNNRVRLILWKKTEKK